MCRPVFHRLDSVEDVVVLNSGSNINRYWDAQALVCHLIWSSGPTFFGDRSQVLLEFLPESFKNSRWIPENA
jgi:hypothetical protein